MATLGLGKTAWGIVFIMTLLNWYAILPTVGGLEFATAAVGLPLGAYLWVRFLRFVYVHLIAADRPAAAHVE